MFSSLIRCLYKYLCNFPVISISYLCNNVITSTRINSSSVHMYISVCFIQNIQYSTWCQNRGCICISSRRTYRSNPHPSCIHSTSRIFQRRGKERSNNISQSLMFYKSCNRMQQVPVHYLSNHRNCILIPRRLYHSARNSTVSSRRNFILTTRDILQVFSLRSKHSKWQKFIPCPYSIPRDTSISTGRNSILSGRQHPHSAPCNSECSSP